MSVKAMSWAIQTGRVRQLSGNERLILMTLAHYHHSKTGECFPAIDTIAEDTGLKRRAVQKILRGLHDRGVITIEERAVNGRQRSNQYALLGVVRDASPCTPQEGSRGAPRGTPQRDNRGVHPGTPDREVLNSKGSTGGSTAASLAAVIALPKSSAAGGSPRWAGEDGHGQQPRASFPSQSKAASSAIAGRAR